MKKESIFNNYLPKTIKADGVTSISIDIPSDVVITISYISNGMANDVHLGEKDLISFFENIGKSEGAIVEIASGADLRIIFEEDKKRVVDTTKARVKKVKEVILVDNPITDAPKRAKPKNKHIFKKKDKRKS